MASKVSEISKVLGHYRYEAGAHLYHAKDGARDGGEHTGMDTHRIRKALHKLRLRASGMSDDLSGSKEVDGTIDNRFEQTPKQ